MSLRQEEKTKPFRLVKYFTFTSIIVTLLGSLILCILNIHWIRTVQFKKSEEYAKLLIENLNHQIYTQFQIPVYYIFGKIQLSNKRQFELMDKIVRNTLHSFKVDLVNLYETKTNIISYSFDPQLVGKRDLGGRPYQDAVAGKATTILVNKEGAWKSLLGIPSEMKVITFAPLREARPLTRISGKVLGVIEIVQDLSEDYKAVARFQVRVIITCCVVMGILLVILTFIVQKGETIIEQRNQERIRLKEQLSRAERLSALGEMVAAISHEIRNPLGIIRSSAELLKKRLARTAPDPLTDIIVEESIRLNSIITDFLEYARPRLPHLVPCRIREVLEKNIAFLGVQMADGNHSIKLELPDGVPEIMADPDMLYQAFLNLLLNAMQAMPNGGEIQVGVTITEDRISVSIKDKGPGISPELIEKIWDPFFTTKDTGTGLGMGIVKNIVEAHHGLVLVENRPIYGTQVTVELPVMPEDGGISQGKAHGNHPDR